MTGDLSDLHDLNEFTTTVKRSKRGESLGVFTGDAWVNIALLFGPLHSKIFQII
jgi:hypothetical protein